VSVGAFQPFEPNILDFWWHVLDFHHVLITFHNPYRLSPALLDPFHYCRSQFTVHVFRLVNGERFKLGNDVMFWEKIIRSVTVRDLRQHLPAEIGYEVVKNELEWVLFLHLYPRLSVT